MARGARYLNFEGQFESNVLGTFRIIRGFANLKDLAEISVLYEMGDGGNGVEVVGQQRKPHISAILRGAAIGMKGGELWQSG